MKISAEKLILFLVVGVGLNLIVSVCRLFNVPKPNTTAIETAIKLNNLTTSRNYKEKELKKLENKLKHYEDSLQSTKNYIDILIANPNRKQLDSLRARYNPK